MRKPTHGRQSADINRQKALLVTLSDDLTLPLLQIKAGLELLTQSDTKKSDLKTQARLMSLSADTGLQLAEAYRLVLQSDQLPDLPLEPVAVGAVLEEVAHQLSAYANQYATKLHVDIQGRLAPVLAHQPALAAAIQCLSSSLIRAQAAQTKQKEYHLILGAHRSGSNMVAAGVFSNVYGLSDRTLRAARSLAGSARQPLPALPGGAASGVLIADMLCTAMWQPLRAAAHKNLPGLAVGVPASKQLNFI